MRIKAIKPLFFQGNNFYVNHGNSHLISGLLVANLRFFDSR